MNFTPFQKVSFSYPLETRNFHSASLACLRQTRSAELIRSSGGKVWLILICKPANPNILYSFLSRTSNRDSFWLKHTRAVSKSQLLKITQKRRLTAVRRIYMAKTLVLAEKPSVARELARVLGCKKSGEGFLEGERYIVTWALGHLVELAPPEDYDKAWAKWDMLTLPMLPDRMKTVVIPQSGRQFRAVQAQMRRGDVSDLVIATDAGREGELVARWIMEKAGWKKPAKRLWISSQTDKAIKEGFAHLRPAADYDNLYHSARARSVADWVVGLNVTRALTCKYNAQLSAGRVQTPTLALIVDREEEIRKFQPKEFYTVFVKLNGFTATWRDKNGQARIFSK